MTLEIGQVIKNTMSFGAVTIVNRFWSDSSNDTIYKVQSQDGNGGIYYADITDLQPEPDSIPEIDG